jgi:hypothetical protein
MRKTLRHVIQDRQLSGSCAFRKMDISMTIAIPGRIHRDSMGLLLCCSPCLCPSLRQLRTQVSYVRMRAQSPAETGRMGSGGRGTSKSRGSRTAEHLGLPPNGLSKRQGQCVPPRLVEQRTSIDWRTRGCRCNAHKRK